MKVDQIRVHRCNQFAHVAVNAFASDGIVQRPVENGDGQQFAGDLRTFARNNDRVGAERFDQLEGDLFGAADGVCANRSERIRHGQYFRARSVQSWAVMFHGYCS